MKQQYEKINAECFAKMVEAGAANLQAHVQEVNDLNVFPIPDGDTGDNMLLTMLGGVKSEDKIDNNLSKTSNEISSGMLLSARGNSGVILSQFFDGITSGFGSIAEANVEQLGKAFLKGVEHAYNSVIEPTEGTILTVIREATESTIASKPKTPIDFFTVFIENAKKSLDHTPELLPVLKEAGVVDSGGAGLIYIIEGMRIAMSGEKISTMAMQPKKENELDISAFDENSELTFGYCTELLLRLQNKKVNVSEFKAETIIEYLKTIGDSIVAVKNDSIVKIHVHTMTPDKVLSFCQQFGEFLKVKIENMSLQHNNTIEKPKEVNKKRKKFGVVSVANGQGIKDMLTEIGADIVIDGGQSMNPSTELFLEAFDEVNADTIFVYPNNGNIVLTAKQAGSIYEKSDIRVIESHTIGQGYASLAMLDTELSEDELEMQLNEAMDGVITAEVSKCIKNASLNGVSVEKDDYIGFVGKEILASSKDRVKTVCDTIDELNLKNYDSCILISGKDASEEDTEKIESYVSTAYKNKELYVINGQQGVYDYILIVQ